MEERKPYAKCSNCGTKIPILINDKFKARMGVQPIGKLCPCCKKPITLNECVFYDIPIVYDDTK